MLKADFMENIASLYCFKLESDPECVRVSSIFLKGEFNITRDKNFPELLGDDMWIVLKNQSSSQLINLSFYIDCDFVFKKIIFLYYKIKMLCKAVTQSFS